MALPASAGDVSYEYRSPLGTPGAATQVGAAVNDVAPCGCPRSQEGAAKPSAKEKSGAVEKQGAQPTPSPRRSAEVPRPTTGWNRR